MIYSLDHDYYVRGLQHNDLSGPYPDWFQDQEVCRHSSHGKFPKTRDWFENYYKSSDGEDRVVWAICHREDGHIGNISLQSLSVIDRRAEFSILIGEKKHWGKGLAKKAGMRLFCHGFKKLNLERIYCGAAATNTGMQKLALGLGMVEEGRRRNHLFLEGQWVDVIEFGLLREEFNRQEQQK